MRKAVCLRVRFRIESGQTGSVVGNLPVASARPTSPLSDCSPQCPSRTRLEIPEGHNQRTHEYSRQGRRGMLTGFFQFATGSLRRSDAWLCHEGRLESVLRPDASGSDRVHYDPGHQFRAWVRHRPLSYRHLPVVVADGEAVYGLGATVLDFLAGGSDRSTMTVSRCCLGDFSNCRRAGLSCATDRGFACRPCPRSEFPIPTRVSTGGGAR